MRNRSCSLLLMAAMARAIGDVVMNHSFLAATAVSSMKAWLAAFDTFEALKPQTVVPAHGEVGPGTIIAANGLAAAARSAYAEAQ